MIRGFEILKTATRSQEQEIKDLESKLGFELPCIFRTFMNCFELGDSNLNWQEFLNPKNGYLYPSGSIKYEPLEDKRDLYFNGLYGADELLSDWNNYSKSSMEYQEFGFLRIGDIGVGGGLFLGLKESNREKIFRVVWDWDEDYELLADNILDFIRNLIFVEDESNMEDYTYTQLYKNWDEDFWRVREDQSV